MDPLDFTSLEAMLSITTVSMSDLLTIFHQMQLSCYCNQYPPTNHNNTTGTDTGWPRHREKNIKAQGKIM